MDGMDQTPMRAANGRFFALADARSSSTYPRGPATAVFEGRIKALKAWGWSGTTRMTIRR